MIKREMKYAAFVILLTLVMGGLVSCDGANSKDSGGKAVLTTAQLLDEVDTLVGDTIVMEGVCNWVCEHKGCKLTIVGDTEEQKITIAHDENTDKFGIELTGHVLRVTGVVEEARFDHAYLDNWEAKIKAAEEAGEKTPESCVISLNRISDYRSQIVEREAKEGKSYFSIYSVKSSKVEVVE